MDIHAYMEKFFFFERAIHVCMDCGYIGVECQPRASDVSC